MRTIQLGNTARKVSRIAYGCWRIAGTWDSSLVTAEKITAGCRAVWTAFETGYTLFDLADIYTDGACERIFGQALRENPGMRERIVLITKCGIRQKGDPNPDSPYRYDFTADHILGSCERSLKRLGIETLDVFLLHRPDPIGDFAEVAAAFEKLQSSGKVRAFGVSNFRPSQVTALQRACPMKLLVNQVEISLEKLECFQDGTLDQCQSESITPMAWSPLAGGRLVDTGPIDLQMPDHARRIGLRETLDIVARERGVTRMVVALAWLMKHPAGIVPILGTTHPDRIRDSINAAEIELSRDEWYRLLESALGQRLP